MSDHEFAELFAELMLSTDDAEWIERVSQWPRSAADGARRVPRMRRDAIASIARKVDRSDLAWPEPGFAAFLQQQLVLFRTGIQYWVSPEMAHLWAHAAKSWPGQQLVPDDAPSPAGVIWLPPRCGIEATAVTWHVLDGAAATVHLGAETTRSVVVAIPWDGRHSPHGLKAYAPSLDWSLGPDSDDAGGPEWRALVSSFWTLSAQEMTTTRAEKVRPSEAKRLTKVNAEVTPVRVTYLRRQRSAGASEAGTGPDFSHRWIVSGHWRNQYLPSRETHRLQWIAPHVKGPDDKPLVVKDEVKAWVR